MFWNILQIFESEVVFSYSNLQSRTCWDDTPRNPYKVEISADNSNPNAYKQKHCRYFAVLCLEIKPPRYTKYDSTGCQNRLAYYLSNYVNKVQVVGGK